MAKIESVNEEGGNLHFKVSSPFTNELKIDQSIAHNGVCLTVVEIIGDSYVVTAIEETLSKTNLDNLKIGDVVNLERCMKLGDRLDGHIVQGHADATAIVKNVKEQNGSWLFTFSKNQENLIVEKGSICINGISLTLVDVKEKSFSVAIIPYTYQHTNFNQLKKGDKVNLEYDVIGKYVQQMMMGRLH